MRIHHFVFLSVVCVATSTSAQKPTSYEVNDVHVHLTNYVQEGITARDLLKVMGTKVGRAGGMFALRVEGESMRDEGIFDGDYIIVERRDTARDGERVVALLPDGSTTLKTLFREKDRVRLQPANPEFQPIYAKDVKVQGVVAGVLRKY